MKITHAFYDTKNGQLEVSRHEFDVTVKLNGKQIAKIGVDILEESDAAFEITFQTFQTIFVAANGHKGTNSEVRDLCNEICRFA